MFGGCAGGNVTGYQEVVLQSRPHRHVRRFAAYGYRRGTAGIDSRLQNPHKTRREKRAATDATDTAQV